ncbi:MAG: smalltalk protein [Bacteroidaceae bacterium]|nr:smalltalk protein [Bacteroidaceae bacterium]
MNENKKESIWSKVLRIVITILTAIATSLGTQACVGGCAL